MSKKLRYSLLAAALFAAITIAFSILLNVGQNQAVEAAELIESSINPDTVLKLASQDEAIYYETVEYQRTDPSVVEPSDPYHFPVLPFYNEDRITEHWVTHDGFAQTTVLGTDRSFILQKSVKTADTLATYAPAIGLATSIDLTNTINNTVEDGTDESFVDGTRISHWGQPAWIVKFEPKPSNPIDYQLQAQKLVRESQVVYAADLQFDEIQWEFEIDQESNLLVSQVLYALTSAEPIVLQSRKMSQPIVIPISELPADWADMPVEIPPVNPDLEINEAYIIESSPSNFYAALSSASFPTYLLVDGAFSTFKDTFDRANLYRLAEAPSQQRDSLSFELGEIGTAVEGVQIIYTASTPTEQAAPQAIALNQAPIDTVRPLLEGSLPMWQISTSVNLTVDNREITGWLLSKGVMREEGNNPLTGLIFEIGETLIYIEGQNVTSDELINLATSLEAVQ